MTLTARGSVHKNSYRDSVELMGIAAQLEALEGIQRAGLVMGTPANLAVLAEAGLATAVPDGAGPNDLIVAVAAVDALTADAALARAATLLAEGSGGGADGPTEAPQAQTLDEGVAELPDANLALVSTPGTYATAEALRALKLGLNVFLFSDNVSVEDEIRSRRSPTSAACWSMGPDCGTAIVAGVPLGFANAVRPGPIGLVGASGTGLQQVTSPDPPVRLGRVERVRNGRPGPRRAGRRPDDARGDPAAPGGPRDRGDRPHLQAARRRRRGAGAGRHRGLAEAGGRQLPRRRSARPRWRSARIPAPTFEVGRPDRGRPRRRGAARRWLSAIRAPSRSMRGWPPRPPRPRPGWRPASWRSAGCSRVDRSPARPSSSSRRCSAPDRHDRILDLGDDEYTVGRPHPMIDPRLRNETIVATAEEPAVGMLLLDVVLGHGSHPDPAGALAPAIADAMALATAAGRQLLVVASVCGTDLDPQGLARQERILAQTGVMLESSNARAAMLAATIAADAARLAAAPPGAPLVGAAE